MNESYMWIYTAGDPAVTTVDGAPVGPDGRLWGCKESGKATKVPFEAGRFLLDHLGYTGVVRVMETERTDGTGTDLDIKSAHAESLSKFEAEDARRWRDYVEYCVTDKVNQKRAVPATPDAIKRIMERRGYSLRDYGILPTGETTARDKEMDDLKRMVADLTVKLNDALGEPEPVGTKKR